MDAHTESGKGWFVALGVVAGSLALFGILYIIRCLLQGRRYLGKERLDDKVVIITGCNTGIGKEHALDLAQRGARVYMACRDFNRCEAARLEIVEKSGNANVFNMTVDLGSLASVRDFVKKFLEAESRLDILVNNAGLWTKERQLTVDGFEMNIGVNHMGPFLLTTLLLETLRKSAPSRVVIVSSAGHYYGTIPRDDLNTEKTPFSELYNYCNSKLANVLFMRSLAQRLEGSGVTANALHPGSVATELARNASIWFTLVVHVSRFFMRTPRSGAQTQIRVSVDASLAKVSGKYWDNCREKRPSEKALDNETAEWLWRTSEEWTALKV